MPRGRRAHARSTLITAFSMATKKSGWAYRTAEERRSYDHQRYIAQREKKLEQMRIYREAHREELRLKARKYRLL